MDSLAPQARRLMIRGWTVAAVATPARGPSVPGVSVRSGVIRWASRSLATRAEVAACPAVAADLAPELSLALASCSDGGSTRTWTSAVPASSHCPSL
jgi:hypothetical protein